MNKEDLKNLKVGDLIVETWENGIIIATGEVKEGKWVFSTITEIHRGEGLYIEWYDNDCEYTFVGIDYYLESDYKHVLEEIERMRAPEEDEMCYFQ